MSVCLGNTLCTYIAFPDIYVRIATDPDILGSVKRGLLYTPTSKYNSSIIRQLLACPDFLVVFFYFSVQSLVKRSLSCSQNMTWRREARWREAWRREDVRREAWGREDVKRGDMRNWRREDVKCEDVKRDEWRREAWGVRMRWREDVKTWNLEDVKREV